MKDSLFGKFPTSAFLDSDDLRSPHADLGEYNPTPSQTSLREELLQAVADSDCLIILLSEGALTRPWVLLELKAAIDNDIPIVAVNVSGKGYKYENAVHFLTHLDTYLETANPGASRLLRDNGANRVSY